MSSSNDLPNDKAMNDLPLSKHDRDDRWLDIGKHAVAGEQVFKLASRSERDREYRESNKAKISASKKEYYQKLLSAVPAITGGVEQIKLEVISRKDALRLGLTRYFSGEPCQYGHISERKAKCGFCLECARLRRAIERNRPEVKERERKYRENQGKEKREARTKVRNAILFGRIIKMPCEICGNSKVEAHHDDYSKPLEVRWLCKRHHAEHHANERALAKLGTIRIKE